MSYLRFNRKKASVLPEMRPMFKIAKILLILNKCCSGGKGSLLKLHLFNWAMLDDKRMKILQLSSERKEIILGVWGIDPSLNLALSFAISEGLIVKTKNGMFQLTSKADKFIRDSNLSIMFESKELSVIGKRITEKMVEDTAKRWVNEV